MDGNNKNTFLAIALSILVILGWQFLYVNPKLEAERQAAEMEAARQAEQTTTLDQSGGQSGGQQQGAGQSVNPNLPSAGSTPQTGNLPQASGDVPGSTALNREAALSQSPRIALETARLEGSINLKGGRIDDLRLKDYHETVDKTSPTIILLSPSETPNAFFAEFGFVATDAASVPGPNTVWTQTGAARFPPRTP